MPIENAEEITEGLMESADASTSHWRLTLLLITNGVMIGLMYTLIALGFVLSTKRPTQ